MEDSAGERLTHLLSAAGRISSPAVTPAPACIPDIDRERRKGVPEVILAPTKSPKGITALVKALVEADGRAIISRAGPRLPSVLRRRFPRWRVEAHPFSGTVVIRDPNRPRRSSGGRVAILTAGTGDNKVAEEARIMAEEMGCETLCFFDVGVAGIHRLAGPLSEMAEKDPDAIVVAAGMDGALPSVVAGLVDVPVIGVPTAVGYGLGGEGLAALLSMLQTCSPGLSVVNIGNGIGAGATAALIANRAAGYREQASLVASEALPSKPTTVDVHAHRANGR